MEFENAKITAVSLTMEDHGVLTFYLTLEGAGWGVNFGGYCIGKGYLGAKNFSASSCGLEAMMRIMDTVGVSRWEDLNGKYIRVNSPTWGNRVTKIGNIVREQWFDVDEFFRGVQEDGKHEEA